MLSSEQELQLLTDINALKQCLLGYAGQKGLVDDVNDVRDDYYKFKKWVIGVLCFAVGSGVLGISLYQVIGVGG